MEMLSVFELDLTTKLWIEPTTSINIGMKICIKKLPKERIRITITNINIVLFFINKDTIRQNKAMKEEVSLQQLIIDQSQ